MPELWTLGHVNALRQFRYLFLLCFAFAFVLAGLTMGALGGIVLGQRLVGMYHLFFRFPELLLDDASGDTLDAVLCLMQAAWALQRPDHGLPAGVDPLEGWIASA